MKEYVQSFGEFVNENYVNISFVNESKQGDKIEKELHAFHNELVHNKGMAKTVEGEMVRAMERLLYRYFNDGDYYFRGYGKQTCAPSVEYLKTKTPISKQLTTALNAARKEAGPADNPDEYTDNDGYYNNLLKAAELIVDYVKSKKGVYEPNTIDSRF